MTNGSSQGLFVVVGVVIFGIFVAISYSLFRDQLTPSLASIFSEHSSTLPSEFYLPDTPKGKEYSRTIGTSGFEEYVRVQDIDISKLGDVYSRDTLFEITFSLKTLDEGTVRVYTQNGSSSKYSLLFEDNGYQYQYDYRVHTNGNDEYQTFTKKFKIGDLSYGTHGGKSYLSFYSEYGTANKVTVKDISIRKIGTLK